MTNELVKLDERKEQQIASITERVNNLTITCQADKQRAVDFFRDVKAIKLEVEAMCMPNIERAKKLASGLTYDMKKKTAPLEEGMLIIKDKINDSDEGWHVDGEYKRRDVKITINDESLIPREYLMVDIKKLTKVCDALGEDTHIPGVEVEVTKKTVIRME